MFIIIPNINYKESYFEIQLNYITLYSIWITYLFTKLLFTCK